MEYSEENFLKASTNDTFDFECKKCGKGFTKTKRYISKNSLILPLYCSQECSRQSKNLGTLKIFCTFCSKEKEILYSEYNKSKSKLFFCDNSCSAKYNNPIYHKKDKKKLNKNECPCCGEKLKKSKLCNKCRRIENTKIGEKELGYYIGYGENRKKYISSKCQCIRTNAKKIINEDHNREKVCAICKNHEFDNILEVHHIKPISSFDEHTKIQEINNLSNLIWLCPNHHTMVEKGYIKL